MGDKNCDHPYYDPVHMAHTVVEPVVDMVQVGELEKMPGATGTADAVFSPGSRGRGPV